MRSKRIMRSSWSQNCFVLRSNGRSSDVKDWMRILSLTTGTPPFRAGRSFDDETGIGTAQVSSKLVCAKPIVDKPPATARTLKPQQIGWHQLIGQLDRQSQAANFLVTD